jgi:hypothetical protein
MQPQQARQENGELAWSTIVREHAFGVAVFALIIVIVMMGPTIGQYSTGVWSTAQTFRSWCQGERVVPFLYSWGHAADKCFFLDRESYPHSNPQAGPNIQAHWATRGCSHYRS